MDKMHDCPVMVTIKAIGGKWKPRILWTLRSGPKFFGELCRATGASEKMLARSLRDLVAAGLIERKEIERGDIRMVMYTYSQEGETLIPVLDAMGEWGLRLQRK